ncbi:MAG: methyltransferase domain-containing protein [Actinomycetota bacterium]|nr:methyltransferase domain-containing protein [Actinomycetota bacterium]MDA2971903.1 methyltransferase domain-containing protein [Actinomycetota bacterium]MDA3002404.1 methyltransferase domain-containing protein [Actinomycetota bacterium]
MDATAEAYDSFQYENLPFRMSHPDWLCTLGTLAGLDPPGVATSRVLEIGCARGGHLIPLAELLPEATFVGIDLSPSQISEALIDAAGVGLENVTFHALDVRELGEEFGKFDYIVCHGVYSWVPEDARSAILRACRDLLTESGLAYVSYNTFPGWHARGMLRSMFARVIPDGLPGDRVLDARTFLDLLDQFVPDTLPLRTWLETEINLLRHYSDRYLFFEHLVEENSPCHFSDFMERAHSFDLIHVADAEVASGSIEQMGKSGSEAISRRVRETSTPYHAHLEAQQLLDFLTLRHFRRSILTHSRHLDRVRPEFDASAVTRTFVSLERVRTNELGESEIELDVDAAEGLEVSLDDDGRFVVTSGDPIPILAMWTLANNPRRGLWVDELAETISTSSEDSPTLQRVAEWALSAFLAGEVQLSRWPRPVAYELPEHPRVSRLARWQASRFRTSVTNLRHEELEIDDLDRVVIVSLDGSRTIDEIVEAGLNALTDGTVEVEVDGQPMTDVELLRDLVATKVGRLVNRGLVMAD